MYYDLQYNSHNYLPCMLSTASRGVSIKENYMFMIYNDFNEILSTKYKNQVKNKKYQVFATSCYPNNIIPKTSIFVAC